MFGYANQLDTPEDIKNRPLKWRKVATPQPGKKQILIRVSACGVCGSNLHMIRGDWEADGIPAKSPIVPGHELVGTVVTLGGDVSQFDVGDRVGVQPLWWACGECEYCIAGLFQLCHSRIITGEHVDGGYAEFVIANEAFAYKVPPELELSAAAPLFCPGLTAYSAVAKAGLKPGDTAILFGIGGVGHMAVQFAKLRGANVVAVSRSKRHLELAEDLGADSVVDLADNVSLGRLRETADATLLFGGSGRVSRQALDCLKWGGVLVNAVPISIDEFPFNKNQIIKGSILGNHLEMKSVLDLAVAGKIRTVINEFDMADANGALSAFENGEVVGRAVLVNRSV